MHVHVSATSEPLLAKVTLVWSFSCMNVHVFLKSLLGGEAFTTLLALKGLSPILSVKNHHMKVHSRLWYYFPAVRTRQFFVYRPYVFVQVRLKFGFKLATVTLEHRPVILLALFTAHVSVKVSFVGEGFAA